LDFETVARSRIVTLTTDFGTADPYVAAMKGVILTACPSASIVDISHGVPPQDVLSGAVVLAEAAAYFPAGTLHVVVVDPGVGTERSILIARFGEQHFLFPDNGVITLIAQRLPLKAIFSVRNARYLPAREPSRTFHGRDVFAPVAGLVLNGLDISKLGPQPDRYKLLDVPTVRQEPDRLVGSVIYADRFGNLISNIRESQVCGCFPAMERVRVYCGGTEIGPLVGAYGFAEEGQPLALFNSMGALEIAVNKGSAREVLGLDVGAEVNVVDVK